MKLRIALLGLFVCSAIGCRSDGGENTNPIHDQLQNKALIVANISELPLCDAKSSGQSFYVKEASFFQTCKVAADGSFTYEGEMTVPEAPFTYEMGDEFKNNAEAAIPPPSL